MYTIIQGKMVKDYQYKPHELRNYPHSNQDQEPIPIDKKSYLNHCRILDDPKELQPLSLQQDNDWKYYEPYMNVGHFWLVYMSGDADPICTGTIIRNDPRYNARVLTAAHCLTEWHPNHHRKQHETDLKYRFKNYVLTEIPNKDHIRFCPFGSAAANQEYFKTNKPSTHMAKHTPEIWFIEHCPIVVH